MPVCTETCGNVRLEIDNHQRTEQSRHTNNSNSSDVTRTHKCNYNKGEEENQRRTEILHKEKRTYTAEREDEILSQTSCVLQLIQRRRTDKYKRKLYEL